MSVVSVIIPVYNRVKLLERAVTSVLQQSFHDFECIVIDDGSDDGCGGLPCFKDPRLRYLRLPDHVGVSRARNHGVSDATASWIAFLDSDDEWLPEKLERQMEWTAGHPSYLIFQTREEWIRNGVRVNPPQTHEKRGGDLFAVSLERCMITPSSVMLRKELFIEYGGFNEAMPACEDYDLWLRITAHHPIGLVDEVLLRRYGGHGDQLSATVPQLDRFRIRSLLGLLSGGNLTTDQAILVKRQLIRKATICANGYKKRGNSEFGKRYETIAGAYGRCESAS
ncbi:MAG: glycosyltransferase family 2 protein [Chitinispirillaceae bacterium]|nr:glycosyltransferase family 2 protein [Chitinispirillaceae bacterium]